MSDAHMQTHDAEVLARLERIELLLRRMDALLTALCGELGIQVEMSYNEGNQIGDRGIVGSDPRPDTTKGTRDANAV